LETSNRTNPQAHRRATSTEKEKVVHVKIDAQNIASSAHIKT